MAFIDSFPHPFHDQNTQQPSSSLVEKSQNCKVSNAMSLVYVDFMSCMHFIVGNTYNFSSWDYFPILMDFLLPPMVQISSVSLQTLQVRSTLNVI